MQIIICVTTRSSHPHLLYVLVGLPQLSLHHPNGVGQRVSRQSLNATLEGGRKQQRLPLRPHVIADTAHLEREEGRWGGGSLVPIRIQDLLLKVWIFQRICYCIVMESNHQDREILYS